MRARRLVSLAVVATLGVLSLGACGQGQGSDTTVAAYVGDTRIPVSRVDQIYTEAQQKYHDALQAQAEQAGQKLTPEQLTSSVTRQDVVNLLVGIDLGKRVAAANQITIPDEVNAQALVQQIRMPADTAYAQLWAEWIDIYQALGAKLPPAELTDESVMKVYQALVDNGLVSGGQSVAGARKLFGAEGSFVRTTTGVASALGDQGKQVQLTVNPRFRPLSMPTMVRTPNGLAIFALPYAAVGAPVSRYTPNEPAATAQ